MRPPRPPLLPLLPLLLLELGPRHAAAQAVCSVLHMFRELSAIKESEACRAGCAGGECGEDWMPGAADACSAECGLVFEPFWDRCGPMLLATAGEDWMEEMPEFHVACLESLYPPDVCGMFCNEHTFECYLAEVQEACCDEGGANCVSGEDVPLECFEGCAIVFPQFLETCHDHLSGDESIVVEDFEAFAQECRDVWGDTHTPHGSAACTAAVDGCGVCGGDGTSCALSVDGLAIAVTDGAKLCFDPLCAEPVLDHRTDHTVVLEGCAAGGALGSTCRIGCMAGFDASAETEGRCTLNTGGSRLGAAYTGQNVTCRPERAADGSMSEAYCRLASTEAILDCCDAAPGSERACSRASPPRTCVLGCAERWLPLLEDCEPYLSEFSQLSEACEAIASEFLNTAPSSMQLAGAQCHPDANGVYLLQPDTIGGKPHYALQTQGGQAFNFYAINEPHSGFVVGSDMRSHVLVIEDYESTPPWGAHEWREVCAQQSTQDRTIVLTPTFTMEECEEELQLLTPELTEFCAEDGGPTFEQSLASDTSLSACPYDCAHRWFLYSEECSVYLARRHPGLADFTAACTTTHTGMAVIQPVDAHLAAGTQDQHFFSSEQGLVYEIEEVPGDGLQRTELAVIAPGTHHVLADRLDVNEQGAGAHQIDWYAPQTELGVDITVGALEGDGDYHLEANIIGTAERLAPEAIVYSHNSSGVREILLQVECRFFDDCTYRYHGAEMRGDGSSYVLRFHPTAGMTYAFRADLKDGSAATHIRFAIFPPDSIAANADGSEVAAEMAAMFNGRASSSHEGGDCELPPLMQQVQADPNVVDMNLGRFAAAAGGRLSWGALKCEQEGAESRCCEDPTRVGPPEQSCGGSYRHYPGETFDPISEWEWTAPSTGEFLLKVTSNCDVLYYADPEQPGCQTTADGVRCSDTSIEQCASAVGLTIVTVDRAVHIKHRFDIPLPPAASEDQRTLLASMFRSSQAPAMTFPTKIMPLDCNNPDQARNSPLCEDFNQRQNVHGRRRELQQQLGCPHSTFLAREQRMLVACRLTSSVDEIDTSRLPTICPSLECAEELVDLLGNCQESIHGLQDAPLYLALEQSSMLMDCREQDQQAAHFATIEVEFHAPSLEIANDLIAEHEERSAQLATMFTQPGCSGSTSESGRRRSLESSTESELVAALRLQLRERDQVIAERDAKITERDAKITERDAKIAERDAKIAERDAKITERDAHIAERDAHIAEQDAHIAERDAKIEELQRRADPCNEQDEHRGEWHSETSHVTRAEDGSQFRRRMQRRRTQDESICHGSVLTSMFSACCESPAASGGHRRSMQSGCDAFPSTCSASCAPLFIEFYSSCQGMIQELGVAEQQEFTRFHDDCAPIGGVASSSVSVFGFTTLSGKQTACLAQPCTINGLCMHDGVCIPQDAGAFRCECSQGYNGTRCERRS